MAGSRKGDRRGAARKRITDPVAVVTARATAIPRKNSEAYMREIAMVLTATPGHVNLEPKYLLLEGQNYFWREVLELQKTVKQVEHHISHVDTTNRAEVEQLDELLDQIKRQVRDNMVMAGEFARNAAPYFHPRKGAVPDSISDVSDPMEVLRLLLREIDEMSRGKPTWMPGTLKLVSSQ